MAKASLSKVFDFGERLGLFFITEAAFLSAIAIVVLLCYIWWKTIPGIYYRRPGHADLYFFSLLIADLMQALGSIMDLKWVLDARITEGTYCISQGALKQLGDTGVALSSMAIAVDTFAILFFRWHRPEERTIPCVVLACIWLFILFAVFLPYSLNDHYFSDTEYWCWIGPRFLHERLGLEYVWMWACALALIVLYTPLFFRLRGNLVVKGLEIRWRRLGKIPAWARETEAPGASHARVMLWYPVVYFITVFPMAVARWTSFSKPEPYDGVPFAATTFAGVLFSLSGFFNVMLFTLTRPGLIPHRHRHGRQQLQSTDHGPTPEEDDVRSVRPSIIDQLESYGAVEGVGVGADLERGGIRIQPSYSTQATEEYGHHATDSTEAIESLHRTMSGDSRQPLSPRAPARPPRIELI